MKILMGTKNPGKIEGAKQAFEKYFDNVEIEGIPVSSNVGDQPINEEIFQGAKNRVKNLKDYATNNNIPNHKSNPDFKIKPWNANTNIVGSSLMIPAMIIKLIPLPIPFLLI